LGRSSFGLFDDAAAQRVEGGHPAFQVCRIDAELTGNPLFEFLGRALVEGENKDFFGVMELLIEDIGHLADHGGGLSRPRRGDQKVVVLQTDAGLPLLVGQGSSVEVVEERTASGEFGGNKLIIVPMTNGWIGKEGERRRQGRLQMRWHHLRIE
jgi:hypothetical protein